MKNIDIYVTQTTDLIRI